MFSLSVIRALHEHPVEKKGAQRGCDLRMLKK